MDHPRLFVILCVGDQPARLVFHGNLSIREQDSLIDVLNAPGKEPVRLVISEKFHDSGFHYTIFRLDTHMTPEIEERIRILYPSARNLKLDDKSAIRDAVRSIVIF